MKNTISYWRNKNKNFKLLGKMGEILSLTKINNPPMGFGNLPYLVGIVKLKDGQQVTAQLVTEGKKAKIGSKAVGILRIIGEPNKEGIINYGVKFKIL